MSPDENKTPAELIAEEEARRRARIAEQDKRIAEFQHEQLRRLVRLLPVFLALLATIGAISVASNVYTGLRSGKDAETRARVEIEHRLEESRAERDVTLRQIAELKKTNDDLQAQLKKVQESGTKGRPYSELSPSDRDLVNHVKSDEEQLQTRLSKLEETLGSTPEKALSTVMLKQRLDDMRDRTRGDIDSIHGEIGRLFTLTQWFIGLIFTISLGLLGLGLANLRKPKA